MYLLARHLTGREWPSIVAGIVYAFTPYRFVHFPQIQLQSMEWFPLAFLCLHLFYERGERRYAAGVGVFVVIEALCCVYYAIFLVIALVVAAVVLAARDSRARDGRAVVTLLIVGCLTAITVVPLAGEYVRVHRTQHLERSFAEISRHRPGCISGYGHRRCRRRAITSFLASWRRSSRRSASPAAAAWS